MYFEKMNIVVCNFTDHYGERIINMTGVQILRCPKRRRTKLRIGCDTLGWECRGPGLGGIWVGPGKKRPDAAIITDTLLTKQFSRINIHEGVMYLKRLFIAVWGRKSPSPTLSTGGVSPFYMCHSLCRICQISNYFSPSRR